MSSFRKNLIDPFLDIHGVDVADAAKVLAEENTGIGASTQTGTGDSVSAPDVNLLQTMVDAGAAFTTDDPGRFMVITGMGNANNNGTFLITDYVSPTSVKIYNPTVGAGAEVSAFSWDVHDPYMLSDDVNFVRTDRRLIKGTANYYDAVPTYNRPSATGTPVPKNLTNLLSVDAFVTVRDVRQNAVKLRPNITAADGALLIGDETFTTTLFHFNADDLNSFIVITGSTDANGTYRIKAVTDGQTLELDGLASLTAEACTWELISERKGILSSRSYADATDERGIPIADAGSFDNTAYDATFVEVIDPLHQAGITKNDETKLWARSYGNELDPKRTATDEGVRFFVQLKTGLNTGAAVTSLLESLAGRSGAAAILAGGSKVVTGLTGMLAEDVGRYLTLYGCGVDTNAGHYKITVVTSATQVTVEKTANFAADSGIDWKVSKHPGTFDFYNGDRYLNSELTDTWARTTMVGGIETDAQLAQEIADLREFCGADLTQTAPNLGPNTGADFVWSDLPDPTNSNVEEALNMLNQQIGDRQYTGTILTDGETITASLQALSSAIDGATVTRTIERRVAVIPKNTVHVTPITYTLDGTGNGRNLWVFVRKQLLDPGLPAGGNDYAETNTTSLTFYEKVNAGDHINYFVLQ